MLHRPPSCLVQAIPPFPKGLVWAFALALGVHTPPTPLLLDGSQFAPFLFPVKRRDVLKQCFLVRVNRGRCGPCVCPGTSWCVCRLPDQKLCPRARAPLSPLRPTHFVRVRLTDRTCTTTMALRTHTFAPPGTCIVMLSNMGWCCQWSSSAADQPWPRTPTAPSSVPHTSALHRNLGLLLNVPV